MRVLRGLAVDLLLVAIATVLALLLRDNFEISSLKLLALAPYGGASLIAAAAIFPLFGVNRALWHFTSMRDYLAIVGAALATVLAAVALSFVVNRLDGVARAIPILQALLIVTLLVGLRVMMRLFHLRARRSSARSATGVVHGETVLIVGVNKLTELYLQCVAEFAKDQVKVAGLLDDNDRVGAALLSHRVLGRSEQIAEVLRTLEVHGVNVDRILVATPFDCLSAPTQLALRVVMQTTTIEVEHLKQSFGLERSVASRGVLGADGDGPGGDAQVFSFRPEDMAALMRSPSWRLKRILDVVGAFSLIVILAPVMVVVAALVALDVGLPVMFWQQRPGLGGRPFRLYKFRTMGAAHDAQGRRRSDDERLSVIGAFLRRTRLDELPQLVSILRGQMSFVGPRPLLPVDQPAAFAARLLVRPGLTGWAQVKGGRTIDAADKAALDVWYVHNLTLLLDLKIILATVPMVLFGERVFETAIEKAWRDLCDAGVCAPEALTVRTF